MARQKVGDGAKSFSVSVRGDQAKFLDERSRQFNLSKFVQVSLDAYIKYVRRIRV